jgi:hypothetical protein
MASLGNRMIRAAKLDVSLYEEVEADTGATGQAMLVVVLSSLAAGIGIGNGGLIVLLLGAVAALLAWYIWAFLTYFIGTRFLPEAETEADVGQLLRTIGFASSPGLLRILGVIPGVFDSFTQIVFLGCAIWMLVAMIIAVRQALDYRSTGRAIIVCLIGWVIQVVILGLVMMLLGNGPQP